jgi:hypothetical protein
METEAPSKVTENRYYMEFAFPGSSPAVAPRALLSLKEAGDMKYDPRSESAARLAFFRHLGIEPERIVGIELKHTRNVAFIDNKEDLQVLLEAQPEGGGFDGIVTTNPRLVPSVTVADCMPIYLACEKAGAFGVLHSGWKGTGILKTAVEGMIDRYLCKPSDLSIIFGPAIGPCCYAVDAERAALFRQEFSLSSVREEREGEERRYYLDLLAANVGLAQTLGIARYDAVRSCTSCDVRFGSFRRDGPQHFTRMLALTPSPFPY